MRHRFLNCLTLCLLTVWFLPATLSAAEPKVTGLSFPLGERSGENPAARVQIDQLVQSSKKRGFFRVAMLPTLVASGISVTFYRPEAECLINIQETIQALTKVDRAELRQIKFFVPSNSTPRLIAQEIVVHSKDTWTLKQVQFPGQPSVAECRLSLKSGAEGGLFFASGGHLSLETLLGTN